ncbi:hypothetical protein LUR59_004626 [Vibrio parahaemolyticus]|uniref:hypothetical protein n=1 Tax=Vibrio parahaemolyticus TaxID=670 RepID=UPI0009EFB526|nr:hypothetical protein [Vibrio parahaemolyticus]EIQ1514432.1 hypothetical protein [Vibrio parahaemolyticus]EJT1887597.1 hypothetical protein [Vibrio parahaemolyticus]ELB2775248.1 hypothetical protein [Vibrio parahaemolyticus]OQT95724.1 hypothetical protein EN00_022385 [Vibrio parahaemolyticus]
MEYEKPRKGNPLGITLEQHFHSAHSIGKFYNHKESVEVHEISTCLTFSRKKRAKIFCTKRNWDERAEHGYMANIEHDFHDQIDNLGTETERDHKAISRYFNLWRLRHQMHLNRLSNAKLHGISGEELTKEQQETLEVMHVGYVNSDGEIPARQLTGGQIQLGIDQLMLEFKDTRWGLLQAKKGHFLCADSYHELCIMPISPKFAFAANLPDQILTYAEVATVNKQSIESAKEFYFAKSLKKCPIA